MSLSGLGSVRLVKNCDLGLGNAARGCGLGQHFQARGHSFSLYGPTLSRTIGPLQLGSRDQIFPRKLIRLQDLLNSARSRAEKKIN